MRKRGERQQTSVDPLCQVHNRATFDEQIDRVAIYPGDEDEATDLSARSPRGKKNTLRRCRTGLASGPPSLEVSDDSVAYARP
jgi:hypothetical protein